MNLNRRNQPQESGKHPAASKPGAPWAGAASSAGARAGLALAAMILANVASRAAEIAVPNGSFELPKTDLAFPAIAAWEKPPKPDWYDESGGFTWDQLAGVFMNQAPTNSTYIDNSHGDQGLYLFAVPQMAVFQDYDTVGSADPAPTHAFDARFEVGKSYDLTVGVIGGGGNMTNGVTMQAALYFRDAASNRVVVAATNITHSLALFPTTTHYVDQSVHLPAVSSADPWAGQRIGIVFTSTVAPELSGGYWDLDNVRLTATSAGPALQGRWTGGRFELSIQSDPGAKLEVLGAANVASPVAAWSSLLTLTNTTGVATYTETDSSLALRFYAVRQLP